MAYPLLGLLNCSILKLCLTHAKDSRVDMRIVTTARRKWAEIDAKRRLRRTSAWKPLQQYLERTNSTGCSYIDYWHIYRSVREHKPKEILELGTGASTIVLAYAIIENGFGRITSMEENQRWFGHAMVLMPEGLPVEILLSETVEDCIGMFRGIRYKDIPDRPYDFVFIDGPSYKTASGDIAFDFDLISVVSKAETPLRAIIDKRITTCFVMQRLLPGKVRYRNHLGLSFVEPVTKADLKTIDSNEPSSAFTLNEIIDFRSA
jgi:hypothetical protein